eukprot:6201465-Pleurochrysis_carterae.AAC.2
MKRLGNSVAEEAPSRQSQAHGGHGEDLRDADDLLTRQSSNVASMPSVVMPRFLLARPYMCCQTLALLRCVTWSRDCFPATASLGRCSAYHNSVVGAFVQLTFWIVRMDGNSRRRCTAEAAKFTTMNHTDDFTIWYSRPDLYEWNGARTYA